MDVVKRLGALIMIALVACSDGGSSTGTTSSGGSSGGGGSSVTLDVSRIFKGNLTLSGTITLPAGTGAGKLIQLTATGGPADKSSNGSMVGNAGTTPGDSVPYTITGLASGSYALTNQRCAAVQSAMPNARADG